MSKRSNYYNEPSKITAYGPMVMGLIVVALIVVFIAMGAHYFSEEVAKLQMALGAACR